MKTLYCKTSRLTHLVLVAMVIALGTIGMAANSAFAANTHMVPFIGSYSGTLTFGANGTPLFSGTGISVQLGKGTNEGYVVVVSTTASGEIVNDNYETLIAANGDSITILSHD